MSVVADTVDIVRFSASARWHLVRDEETTRCASAIPTGARFERGFDRHVVQFRGVSVCTHCLRATARAAA